MKITYSQVDTEYHAIIEHEIARHAAKLNRILKRYSPGFGGAARLAGKNATQDGIQFLAESESAYGHDARDGVGADVLGSAKAAFAELEVQVKKHQAKLRKDYVWKRKRAIALPTPREAPTSD